MKRIMVSACIAGIRCRYDGTAVWLDFLDAIKDKVCLIPVCPEVYGGMPTPRPPGERQGGKIYDRSGEDVTDRYTQGAADVATLAGRLGVDAAILKERSPSCGNGRIYDGSFTSTLIDGDGVLAEMLIAKGIKVFDTAQYEQISQYILES